MTLIEQNSRVAFIDFVQGLLNLDPVARWTPQQARLHPFITGERFTGSWHVGINTIIMLQSLQSFFSLLEPRGPLYLNSRDRTAGCHPLNLKAPALIEAPPHIISISTSIRLALLLLRPRLVEVGQRHIEIPIFRRAASSNLHRKLGQRRLPRRSKVP